jgi:hypothetical protein
LLTVIARGAYSLGIAPCILLVATAGISGNILDEIGELEEQKQILEACKLKLPLTDSVNSQLINREICFKTSSDRYILSAAGEYLFQHLGDVLKYELSIMNDRIQLLVTFFKGRYQ